ncbi:MAG: sigma 54-interacting transcriptional regulator [Planctomycetaceae bacterium]|nr:sigma 54-interacting transcriptional regulator [Planctomycetaceae bacterium]
MSGMTTEQGEALAHIDDAVQILDSIDNPVYVLNSAGDFIYVNDAFGRYTGNSKDYLLRTNIYRIRHTFQPSIFEQVTTRRERVSIFQEITNATKERLRQLTVGRPVFDESGKIKYIIVVLSPLLHLDAMLREAKTDTTYYAFNSETITSVASSPIAESLAMRQLLSRADRAAGSDATCLITGETGAGKEVMAHYIHQRSTRNERHMLVINCSALPDSLLESELFGYEPGAFTGGLRQGKIGVVESVAGGTLFLDEINSLNPLAQSKLLRTLETHRIRRVGGDREIDVDFRLVAASNNPLEEMCRQGTFRKDLYYRLNLINLTIPPLRERKEDILPLAQAFLDEFCDKYNRQRVLSSRAYEFLYSHDWPGNARELRNLVERSVILSDPDDVSLNLKDYLPDATKAEAHCQLPDTFSLRELQESVERGVMEGLSKQVKSTYELADILHINQSTVVRKLKKYGLSVKE